MSKLKNILDIFLKLKEIFAIFATVALWVLALWLNTKFIPLINDIKVNAEVNAQQTNKIEDLTNTVTNIYGDTQYLRGAFEASKNN